MTAKIYRVKLSKSQRSTLTKLTKSGTIKARKLKRVRILLLADENNSAGCRKNDEIADIVHGTGTSLGAYYSGGYAGNKTEGTPDRQDPVADLEIVTVSQFRYRQVLFGGNPDQGKVLSRIAADDARRIFFTGIEHHLDLIGLSGHMVIGKDVVGVPAALDDDP